MAKITKEEFFKMRDEQRAAGLIEEYQPTVIENKLTADQEKILLEALGSQRSGIYRTANLKLQGLLTVEIYTGITIKCQRKKIDEVDNITVWKI